jgi:hypothetical protein
MAAPRCCDLLVRAECSTKRTSLDQIDEYGV